MILIEDTRQQAGKHDLKNEYFASLDIEIWRFELPVGDYMIFGKGDRHVLVDTKKDVLELFQNLTHGHERFRNECIKAQAAGMTLYILIEEELPNGKLTDWKSPVFKGNSAYHARGEAKTKMSPVTARKIMLSMTEKYGVQFRFCAKKDTGRRIIEYLTGARK